MKAFLGDMEIKKQFILRLKDSVKTGRLKKGIGWTGSEGCAIGCTLYKYNSQAFETELGIPAVLARLEDYYYENLDAPLFEDWPVRFLDAIEPGADLSLAALNFFYSEMTNLTEKIQMRERNERRGVAKLIENTLGVLGDANLMLSSALDGKKIPMTSWEDIQFRTLDLSNDWAWEAIHGNNLGEAWAHEATVRSAVWATEFTQIMFFPETAGNIKDRPSKLAEAFVLSSARSLAWRSESEISCSYGAASRSAVMDQSERLLAVLKGKIK